MKADNTLRLPNTTKTVWVIGYWRRLFKTQYPSAIRELIGRDTTHESITVCKFWEDYYMDSIALKHMGLMQVISQMYSVQLYTKTVMNAVGARVNTVEIIGYRHDVRWAARHLQQILMGYEQSYKVLCQEYTLSNRKHRYNGKVGNTPARTRASNRLTGLYSKLIQEFKLWTRTIYSDTTETLKRKREVAEYVLINKSLDLTAHANSAITIRLKLATASHTTWKTRKVVNPWDN